MDCRIDRLIEQHHLFVKLWMHCLGSAEKLLDNDLDAFLFGKKC
jgi:hypothetical protein